MACHFPPTEGEHTSLFASLRRPFSIRRIYMNIFIYIYTFLIFYHTITEKSSVYISGYNYPPELYQDNRQVLIYTIAEEN